MTHPFQNPDLPIENRIENLIYLLSLKEKINFLVDLSEAIPRLGIPKYYHGNECLHGVVRPGRATVFPQAIALAATWDPALIYDVATAISDEARAKHHAIPEYPGTYNGLLTFWSPTVNLARDPRWGRTPETYGEDPYLTGQIGIQFVKGLQGSHPKYLKVVSTPKHFAANNEEHNRFKLKPKISEQWLRDYYLLSFKALIEEGKATSIMGAYNAIFDIPCCHNKMLLTDILRNEWGFTGYAVTDCGGVAHALPYAHNYVKLPTQAAASSINAGIDLECGPIFRKGFLEKAVNKGLVSEQRLNEAVSNVLRARFRLGMFDPPENNPYSKIPFSIVGCEKHSNLALQTARESIVLLKNDPINGLKLLPIDKNKLKSIAVVGPNANIAQFGDYSGLPLNPPIDPLQGIKNKLRNFPIKIEFVPWIPFQSTQHFTIVPSMNLRPKADCGKLKGLVRHYYSSQNFQGQPTQFIDEIIDCNYRSESADPTISNAQTDDSENKVLSRNFSVKWTGFLCPDISGTYQLRVVAKSAKWFKHATFRVGNSKFASKHQLNMVAGEKYPIEIDFPYAGMGSNIRLEWKLPSFHRSATDFNFDREIAAAKTADLILCFSGLSWGDEHEGVDRKDFQLSSQQTALLQTLHKINPHLVLILIAGSNLSLNWEQEHIPSILHAWYPGERGGDAIADVIFGDYNPAGRLPLTFYKGIEQLPAFDDYDLHHGKTYWFLNETPLYAFGFGLSYSTFQYLSLEIPKKSYSKEDLIQFTVQVKNLGPFDGDEVVQVYISWEQRTELMPIKQLKAFKRCHIKKNEIQKVQFEIPVNKLCFWDKKLKKYEIKPGALEIQIGSASNIINLREKLHIIL
jgi:beta-glucosidase